MGHPAMKPPDMGHPESGLVLEKLWRNESNAGPSTPLCSAQDDTSKKLKKNLHLCRFPLLSFDVYVERQKSRS
jgi:hypothetical protein